MKSYKSEVLTVNDPKWYSNTLRFETESEADRYGLDLLMRWSATVDVRVSQSDDEVNYRLTDAGIERIETGTV